MPSLSLSFLFFNLIFFVSICFFVILSKNPVQSVLFLVLVFLIVSMIFLWFGYEFLAILILIIYVGAISTLFLFVVMMFDIRQTELQGKFYNYIPVGFLLGFLWLILFSYSCYNQFSFGENYLFHKINFLNFYWIDLIYIKSNICLLGELIFNHYPVYVWVVSFILLVSMMGSIVLTVDFDYRGDGANKGLSHVYRSTKDLTRNITFWK